MDDKIDWHQQRPAAFAADVALAVLVPRLHDARNAKQAVRGVLGRVKKNERGNILTENSSLINGL